MTSQITMLERFIEHLHTYSHLAIAVSGGVDSMLLMYVAHKFSRANTIAMHACSPAVPRSAYERVIDFAKQHDWQLSCLDAGELHDQRYIDNPSNRCYFCKTNLFQRIASELSKDIVSRHQTTIASGTNIDDLSDFRPGLQAAKEYSVVQPYVDLNMNKADIYQMAAYLQLTHLERLPAQPCLASRIETGIAVKHTDLTFIDDVEMFMKGYVGDTETLRCRITAAGVALEFNRLPRQQVLEKIEREVRRRCSDRNIHYNGVRLYKKGAAFLLNT